MPTMTEPDWPERIQDVDDREYDFRAMGLRPSIVSGILLRLLQYHFSDADNIKDEQLKPYVWNPDRELTRVDVIPGFQFDAKRVDARPSITVVRMGMGNKGMLLNDAHTIGLRSNGNYEGRDYMRMLNGSHEVHAIGGTAMEADRLAEEIYFRMMEYADIIKRDLAFSEFEVGNLGAQKKLELERWLTPMTITWARSHQWTLDVDGPTLRRVSGYWPADVGD